MFSLIMKYKHLTRVAGACTKIRVLLQQEHSDGQMLTEVVNQISVVKLNFKFR